MPRLRVAINAQLKAQTGTGGIETVLRFLTRLCELDDGDEQYVFIGLSGNADWLRALVPAGHSVVSGPGIISRAKASLHAMASPTMLPVSDGFFEKLECAVIHFPYQRYVKSTVPSVFSPHDLQHVHFPEFFSRRELRRREETYNEACHAARSIVVASTWVKQDIVRSFGVDQDKIDVVPWAPRPVRAIRMPSDAEWNALREKHRIPDGQFGLYPAMTWEHKNHLRLIDALALLRDRGERIRFVCTGKKTPFWPSIKKRLTELDMHGQIIFPGMVSEDDLADLYRRAQFVFVPTLFEAASAPLFEAWQHGAPAGCAAVTSLVEQAADAALLFDPFSIESIAEAISGLARDDKLRDRLRSAGTRHLQDFSDVRTLRSYRAIYRRAAGRTLSEADRALLGTNAARKQV